MKHIKTYEKDFKHSISSEIKWITPLPDEDIKDFCEIIKSVDLEPKLYKIKKKYKELMNSNWSHDMFLYFHYPKNKDMDEISYFILNRSIKITDDVNEFGDEIDINLYFDTKKYNL